MAEDTELHRRVALKEIQAKHANKRGQSRAVHRRGRDHRQSGASGGRSGLRAGNVLRRPAVLHDAVYQG